MYRPTLEEAKELAGRGNLLPIYREISTDLDTPVSAYLKVARRPYSFLLESVEGGERLARYSFIGTEPYEVITTGPGQPYGAVDPLKPVEEALGRYRVVDVPEVGRFNGGAVGFLAYEAVNYFERLPSPEQDSLRLPESVFMLTRTFMIFDHVSHTIRIVSHAELNGDVEAAYAAAVEKIDELAERLAQPTVPTPPAAPPYDGAREIVSNVPRDRYDDAIRRIIDYIYAGDCIQVVYSQRFSRKTDAHPFNLYRALRGINPSPYMFYLDLDDFQLVGASPEMLVRCVDGHLDYHPIAGTRPRGADDEEDAAMEEELKASEKERAEHIMLVGPGAQRRRPGQRARHGGGHGADGGRALLPRDAPGVARHRRAAAGHEHLRRHEVLLSGRHAVRRAEDTGHGDHRRARAGQARPVRGSDGLLHLLGQHGHGDPAADHAGQGRRRPRAGGRRASWLTARPSRSTRRPSTRRKR